MGVSRGELEAKFPQFDYSECREVWDYDEHTTKEAVERAERVRKRVKGLEGQGGGSVYLVSHRGFIAFLVGGKRFDVCGELDLWCLWGGFEVVWCANV